MAGLVVAVPAGAQERAVKIAGFGAKSGVVRVFGINSEAALKAALEQINNAGGVTLGDGAKGKIALEYYDDRCNAEEGISVVRRIASTDAIIAVGPTARTSLNGCSASCRRKSATARTRDFNSRSSRTSRRKADLPRFRNGHSAMCRASSRCTSRCLPG